MAWRILLDPNVQWVLTGSVLLGLASGVLGAFALLRGRSLMGDVLAHAALPGVCLAFMLTGAKAIGPLMIGAAVSGLVATACIGGITRYTRVKEDTALGLVLTVFFGLGVLLLTRIAQSGAGSQSGLDQFLFGQAAALVGADSLVMGVVALVLCAVVAVLFKELKLLCFDPQFARGLGRPVGWIDNALMLMIVGAVVIGLQAVGVVLMAALLITPAAAARCWTERLGVMVWLAGLFGALSGAAGTLISTAGVKLPTGPLIVLAATGLFLISLLGAPRRGLLARLLRFARMRFRVNRENVLRALYEIADVAGGRPPAPASASAVADRAGGRPASTRRVFGRLVRAGLVERLNPSSEQPAYALTDRGREQAYQVVRRHRLWEMFLMYEAELAVDHVDRDADDIEHYLPEHIVRDLEGLLERDGRLPHRLVSVHDLNRGGESPSTARKEA